MNLLNLFIYAKLKDNFENSIMKVGFYWLVKLSHGHSCGGLRFQFE